MPKISVIVPIYNVEPYLRRCINSILAQTITDFDLVLVNDGSPDNCGAICDEYAAKDARITVIHKENGGLSSARNVGIDWAFTNSESEWITFIDSDDWVHPEYLNYLYRAVNETGIPLSVCRFVETKNDNESYVSAYLDIHSVNTESFFCENRVNAIIACGKLYKKSDFSDIRFPVGKLHEDEFTTYKLIFKYSDIAVVSIPLYYYFVNSEGITKSQWNKKRLVVLDALEQQIDFLNNNGFSKARYNSLDILISNYANCIIKLRELYPEEKKTIRVVKRKLKRVLKEEKLEPNDPKNKTVFIALHPHRLKFIAYHKRKIRHLKEFISEIRIGKGK